MNEPQPTSTVFKVFIIFGLLCLITTSLFLGWSISRDVHLKE